MQMISATRIILPAFVLAACVGTHAVWSDFGAEYLGAKYINDPLGESVLPDADPLIRDDAFDCLTFVETVLACGDVQRLNAIRYADGAVELLSRNHFFTADWLVNNSNLVENVSADFGNTATRSGIIDKKSWFQKRYGIETDFAPIHAEIEYVPYSNIRKFDVAEPMLVAFVVDENKTGVFVRHVGFLLPGGVLRHASRDKGRVMDAGFRGYVARRATASTNLGVAFFKIKEFCQ